MKKMLVVLFLLAPCTGALAKRDVEDIPTDLLNKAICVGVAPSELKAAFVIGASYGHGVLVCRKRGTGPWGAPSLFTVGGASVGFQIGGAATDVVFLIMNPKGITRLLQDNVKLGADISVAAGPLERTAAGETDAELHAEILSYSRSRRAFAGVSLDGSVLKQAIEDNSDLYGRPIDPKNVLISGSVSDPTPAAQELDATLTKYSPHGGQVIAES